MVEALAKRSKAHQRYKTSDGKIVPGVTTITGLLNKPALVNWANRMGLQGVDTTKYVDGAARIGTLAHEMVQHDLGGPEPVWSEYSPVEIDAAENSFLTYLEWRKKHPSMETIFIEEQLVSDIYKFGGTMDWYGYMDGKLWLVDIKTGKGVYDEHLFQVSAYRHLLLEHGYNVEGVQILNIPRTEDEFFNDPAYSVRQLEKGFQLFINLLGVYYIKKELKLK